MGFLTPLMKHKRSLLLWGVAGLVLSVLLSVMRPTKYTAKTTILPPTPVKFVSVEVFTAETQKKLLRDSAPRALRRAVAKQRLQIGVDRELVIGIFKSEKLADRLISRFRLAEHYKLKKPLRSTLLKRLRAATKILDGKDGLITIAVTDKQPDMAMQLANAYVEEFSNLAQSLALGEAGARKVFFEGEHQRARNNLSTAEESFKLLQAAYGTVDADAQTSSLLMQAQQLRTSIAANEVKLSVAQSIATSSHPNVMNVQAELAELKKQLRLITERTNSQKSPLNMTLANAPGVQLAYLRAQRELEHSLEQYLLISQLLEMARMDVAQDLPLVKVVDSAVLPNEPGWMQKLPRMMVIAVIFLLVAIILAFLKEAIAKSRYNPSNHDRWSRLDAYRKWRTS